MQTIDEHWEVIQNNMDAIKRIVDGMDAVIHGSFEDRHKWKEMHRDAIPTFTERKAEPLKCYSCDTVITQTVYTVGGRDYCSRYCIAERGGEE